MAVYTTIDDPEAYFQVKTYTGTGSSQAITFDGDTDMQPDWCWIKNSTSISDHVLYDAVRGVGLSLHSNEVDGEDTQADGLTAFGTDGFTVGADDKSNNSGSTLVAWCWKAGTTSGIAGSPSITPTGYSFNATSGCSIIAYDGTGSNATLPHGLGVAPKAVFVKRLDTGGDWLVYHEKVEATEYLRLDNNQAETTSSTAWNDTAPTSTLFSIGDRNEVNNSSGNYVAYCFAEKQGYSKFGSYTGNGSTSGPMIWLGFRPAYVMIKKTNSTGNWCIYDNRREGYNPDNDELYADLTNSLGDVEYVDILSNGFKLTSTTSATNNSGDTYVYFAFAHSPFVNSNGVPTNAR